MVSLTSPFTVMANFLFLHNPSTPTQALDARIGEEEKNRKPKEVQPIETGSGAPNLLPGLFRRLL